MNCPLIFYLSSKTSLCEKAIKKSTKELRTIISEVSFAITPADLGDKLISAVKHSSLIFIVGGMSGTQSTSIVNVLSQALMENEPDQVYKLKNPLSSYDGYLVIKGKQAIAVLPDSPEEIEAILNDTPIKYIKETLI